MARTASATDPAPPTGPRSVLGIAEAPMAAMDPVSFIRSLGRAGAAASRHPWSVMSAVTRLAVGETAAVQAAFRRALGGDEPGPVSPAAGD